LFVIFADKSVNLCETFSAPGPLFVSLYLSISFSLSLHTHMHTEQSNHTARGHIIRIAGEHRQFTDVDVTNQSTTGNLAG
jgi:hypothetical protein